MKKLILFVLAFILVIPLVYAQDCDTECYNREYASGVCGPTEAITYFQCSFRNPGPSIEPPVYISDDTPADGRRIGYNVDEIVPRNERNPPRPEGWIANLPCEKGQWDWVTSRYWADGSLVGENMVYAGTMWLRPDPVDPSRLCMEMFNDFPGARPLGDAQHNKLYQVQGYQSTIDRGDYVEPYLTKKEAYYSFKVWFPEDWAEASDWKLIWQICGELGFYGNPEQHMSPQMALSFVNPFWGYGDSLVFGMIGYYFPDEKNRWWSIIDRASLPKEQWVKFDVFVKQGSAFQSQDGTVIIWMDGEKVFENHNLPTATPSGTPYYIWGIGNYGSSDEPKDQRLLFKDIIVSSEGTPAGCQPIEQDIGSDYCEVGKTCCCCPSDIDDDGNFDYDDFIILSGAFGSSNDQPTYDERADFDQDGDVDYDDFMVLAGNYGKSCSEPTGPLTGPPRITESMMKKLEKEKKPKAYFTLPYLLEVVIPFVSFVIIAVIEIIVLGLIIKKLQKRRSKKRKR